MTFKLTEILKTASSSDTSRALHFPGGVDYYKRYEALDHYLIPVHNEVVSGAVAADGGLLNDHGPEHIKTVIKHACALLACNEKDCDISPYETYLLLCAIQFHDVGNVFGRVKHEQRHTDIMKQFRTILGNDSPEFRAISRISNAHGGKTDDGSKDKISALVDEHVNGFAVRSRLLSAILRFADELADDKFRSNRFLLSNGLLPQESQVFHKYASSIDSVNIVPSEQEIRIKYCISIDDATTMWGKKNSSASGFESVYLIDEIYDRTMKMYLELTYCSRFMRPHINIGRISVTIEIYADPDTYLPPSKTIAYRLEEQGYPDRPSKGIFAMCKELADGETLATTLKSEAA